MTGQHDTGRARLMDIIREKSFRDGVDITLASGRKSTFYFNMKPTMMDPEGAMLLAGLTCAALEDAGAEMIGGLEMGAVPIVAFAAPESFRRGRPVAAFFVRKQAKGHGAQKQIEGLAEGETLAGRRIVIVEDVTTTGGSALKAAELVAEAGGEVIEVLTLVDRQEGAGE
ncbi:MAG: orotate phosphoribosyltransferase, partial [Hyphomicrobiales bacterium]